MKTIKIKVKHMILFIVAICLILILFPYGYLKIADSRSNAEKKMMMYKNFINYYPLKLNKDYAMFSLALNNFSQPIGNYYENIYTNGASQSSAYITQSTLDTSVSLFKGIIDNYKNGAYFEKAYNNLLNIYTYFGNYKEGKKLISTGLNSPNEFVKFTAYKYKMLYLMSEKKYDEVITLGKDIMKRFSGNNDVYKLMADTYYLNQDKKNAVSYYHKLSNNYHYDYDSTSFKLFPENYDKYYYDNFIDKLKFSHNSSTVVKGRVTAYGKGVPFAKVFLRPYSPNFSYSSSDVMDSYFGITDKNGYFSIKGEPIGRYELLLSIPGIYMNNAVLQENSSGYIDINNSKPATYNFCFVAPMKIIGSKVITPQNKIANLSWERVKGAAYYNVSFMWFDDPIKLTGNNSRMEFVNGIKSTNCKIDMDYVNIHQTGYSFSKDGFVNPQAYLGIYNAGCSLPFFISAYNKKGLLITSTIPRMALYDSLPVIKSKENKLSEIEKLIFDKKPEKAVKLIQTGLRKNPNDIKLLNIMSKIYAIGTRIDRDKSIGRDSKRAIAINLKLYKLTHYYEYLRVNSSIYTWDLKDYIGVINSYKLIPNSFYTNDDYSNLGDAYLAIGDLKAAALNYEKCYRIVTPVPIPNISPILLMLYNKNFKEALTILKNTQPKYYSLPIEQFTSDVSALSTSNYTTQEYEYFKKVLYLVFTHKLPSPNYDKYSQITAKIKNTYMKDLLKLAIKN